MTTYKIENDLEVSASTVDAKDVTFTDVEGELTATNVHDALKELFTLSDSNKQALIAAIGNPLLNTSTYQDIINAVVTGKNGIVNAIVSKNVTATNAMGFNDLASKILLIEGTGSGGGGTDNLKLTDEIVATANMAYSIPINGYLMPSQSVAQVYKHNEASPSIIHYQNDFNNANASSFNYDPEKIEFDGMMKIRDTYDYEFTAIDDYYETPQIDFESFVGFTSDPIITDDKITIKALKTTQAIAVANGDIPLDETLEINKTTLTSVGVVRIAMSRDKAQTWQAFDGTNFVDIDINDLTTFKDNGMTDTVINAITKAQWATYRNSSNTLRFAYFIERASLTDTSGTDKITLDANIMARWIPAQTSEYTQEFDAVNQKYVFKFIAPQKYKVRYKED